LLGSKGSGDLVFYIYELRDIEQTHFFIESNVDYGLGPDYPVGTSRQIMLFP